MAETVSSTSGREGLNVRDGALVGAGMICVSGAAIFYKQKRTLPFKLAYFLSWPLLGAALINTFGPRRAAFEQVSWKTPSNSRSNSAIFDSA